MRIEGSIKISFVIQYTVYSIQYTVYSTVYYSKVNIGIAQNRGHSLKLVLRIRGSDWIRIILPFFDYNEKFSSQRLENYQLDLNIVFLLKFFKFLFKAFLIFFPKTKFQISKMLLLYTKCKSIVYIFAGIIGKKLGSLTRSWDHWQDPVMLLLTS